MYIRKYQLSPISMVLSFVSLFLLLSSSVTANQDSTLQPPDIAEYLSEGPHVLWCDSDCATVFYLCGDEIVSHDYRSDDTIRFTGLCADSAVDYSIPTRPWKTDPAVYEGVSRVFAVSDIHGEYEVFESLLLNAGIMDEERNWSFGNGHLVIDGDVFDRGDGVTECLWLIYRLEQQAAGQGGKVHFLLGNHEKMVLRGDERYVNEVYTEGIVRKTRISYQDLFGPDMELGRWLRSKNTIVRINDVLFVHAGLMPWIVERDYKMEEINSGVREALDLKSYDLAFGAEPGLLIGGEGPLWYRGWITENGYPQESPDQVRRTLTHFGAETAVIGHSGVDQVKYLQDKAVIAIDVPVEDLGELQGLLVEDGRFYRILGSGQREVLE